MNVTRENVIAEINEYERIDPRVDLRIEEGYRRLRSLFIREDDMRKRRERSSVENKTDGSESIKDCVPIGLHRIHSDRPLGSSRNEMVVRARAKIPEASEIFLNPWLWLPALFWISMSVSLYLAFRIGLVGMLIGFVWMYPLIIREGVRRLRRLPKSEFWETSEERFQKAIREVAKTKPAPP